MIRFVSLALLGVVTSAAWSCPDFDGQFVCPNRDGSVERVELRRRSDRDYVYNASVYPADDVERHYRDPLLGESTIRIWCEPLTDQILRIEVRGQYRELGLLTLTKRLGMVDGQLREMTTGVLRAKDGSETPVASTRTCAQVS